MDVESRLGPALERDAQGVRPECRPRCTTYGAGPGGVPRRGGPSSPAPSRASCWSPAWWPRSARRVQVACRPRRLRRARHRLSCRSRSCARPRPSPWAGAAAQRCRRSGRPCVRDRHLPTRRGAGPWTSRSSARGAGAGQASGQFPVRPGQPHGRSGRVGLRRRDRQLPDAGLHAGRQVRAFDRRVRQRTWPVHLALRPRGRRRRQRVRRRRQGADARQAVAIGPPAAGVGVDSPRPTSG